MLVVQADLSVQSVVRTPVTRAGCARAGFGLGAAPFLALPPFVARRLVEGAYGRCGDVRVGSSGCHSVGWDGGVVAVEGALAGTLQGLRLGEQLLDGVNEVTYTPGAVAALVLKCRCAFVLQRVIAVFPYWLLLVEPFQQRRRYAG